MVSLCVLPCDRAGQVCSAAPIRLESWCDPRYRNPQSGERWGPRDGAGMGKGTFQLSSVSHSGSTVIVLHLGLFMQGWRAVLRLTISSSQLCHLGSRLLLFILDCAT